MLNSVDKEVANAWPYGGATYPQLVDTAVYPRDRVLPAPLPRAAIWCPVHGAFTPGLQCPGCLKDPPKETPCATSA